jgi:glucose-1-phosphate thymidylyltransferase
MYRKSPDRVVFLSSTTKDLAEYRHAAHRAISRLAGYRCVRMEEFTSQASSAETYVRGAVASCDLFVGIVGLCYGSRPRGSSVSFTELEYDAAREAGKPCLMFLTPEDFPVPGNIPMGKARQKRFRKKISQDVIHTGFTSPAELAVQIIEALRDFETGSEVGPAEQTDCIILCGGYSQRLWPLTQNLSKHLLPVGGEPVLSHVVGRVRQSPLIRDIYLLTNPKFAPQTSDFLEWYRQSHKSASIELMVEPVNARREKLGPVGALDYAIEELKPRDLLILAGDNLFGFELDHFLRFARRAGMSANAVHRFPFKEDVSEYGVVDLGDGNTITDFQEKQPISTYRTVSTACYFLRAGDVELIPQYVRGGGNRDSLGSFMHWFVANKHPLLGYEFSEYWFDVGTREKLLKANSQLLRDGAGGHVGGGAQVEGPAQIESSASVKDSRVGPDVYVGANVQIADSEVQNSVIMDDAVITHSSIIDSIVGPRSKIEGSLFEAVCGPGSFIITDSRRGRA